MMPLTNQGPFAVHMSDPPWEADDQLPGDGRGASKKYKTMSTSAIASMPTPIMLPNSVLVLWFLGAMIKDALQVMTAWGFEQKSMGVWDKRVECGKCSGTGRRTTGRGKAKIEIACDQCFGKGEYQHMGMGHQERYAHEAYLIGTRGKNIRLVADMRSLWNARMPKDAKGEVIHSAKPLEMRTRIKRLYPGPYVETFARVEGDDDWTALGDQVPDVMRDRSGTRARGLARAMGGVR